MSKTADAVKNGAVKAALAELEARIAKLEAGKASTKKEG